MLCLPYLVVFAVVHVKDWWTTTTTSLSVCLALSPSLYLCHTLSVSLSLFVSLTLSFDSPYEHLEVWLRLKHHCPLQV